MIMGFSFKNLFKKDKPQENTEHVSLEKSAESDSAKIEGRAKHKKGRLRQCQGSIQSNAEVRSASPGNTGIYVQNIRT